MKYVEIYKTNDNFTQTIIGKFILESDNKIKIEQNRGVQLKKLLINNEKIKVKNEEYSINTDGIKFLEKLQYAFSGSRIRASKVKTK
jgi:hypothetical protein